MRKAQAAMEFLMTYGWAILVVLIALGALFYLGVFDPKIPSTCNIPAPFVCKDFKADANGVVFSLGNVNVNSIENVVMTVDGQTCNDLEIDGQSYTPGGVIGGISGDETTIVCVDTLLSDGKIDAELSFDYDSVGGQLSHSISGEGVGEVEGEAAEAVCGDNIETPPEVCDDGNTVTETECSYGTPTCTACNFDCSVELNLIGAYCGDGNIDVPYEECESDLDCNVGGGEICNENCACVIAAPSIPSGHVLYLQMNGNVDDISNRNDGVISGDVNCGVTGRVGQGCSFDGVGDYISFTPINAGSSTPYTVAGWAYIEDLGFVNGVFGSGNVARNFWLLDTSDRMRFMSQIDGWQNFLLGGSSYYGSWFHFIFVADGSGGMDLYLDGSYINGFTGIDTTFIFENVGMARDLNSYFNGILDEVVLYNRALDPTEIDELYNYYT